MLCKRIWVSWHKSQRSRNLANDLGLPIFEKVIENNIIARHMFSSVWAIYILVKVRPVTVYMQYSFLLLVIAALYKKIAPYQVIIVCDCHTKALRRSMRGRVGRLFWAIKRRSFRSVNVSVISNIEMTPDIKKLTDSYCVLPDKIPKMEAIAPRNINEVHCVFVCSYAVDEPLDDVIAAAERLDGSVNIYCTGRIPDNLKYLRDQPYKNIIFTDYLCREDYENLLSNADCVLALTSEEGCLQCAGYEALSAEVPVVLSNTTALKAYFEDAAIYVDHSAQDIAGAVKQAVNNRTALLSKMSRIKKLRQDEYDMALKDLRSSIQDAAQSIK